MSAKLGLKENLKRLSICIEDAKARGEDSISLPLSTAEHVLLTYQVLDNGFDKLRAIIREFDEEEDS